MKINNPTKVGIMVTIVTAILVVMTIKTGNFNFAQEGYEVKVVFNNISGVNLNSPVMFNGFEMGVVNDINILDKYDKIKMELTLNLDSKARLRKGSKAVVKNLGLMGEKYISLTSGQKEAPYLAPGSIIIGDEPPDFQSLIGEAKEITSELKQLVHEVNERLNVNKGRIDEILVHVNAAASNISSVAANVDERLKVNQSDIDSTMKNLKGASGNLEELSYDLKLNPWKLLYRSKEK